ncbi:hypothetical protein BDV98DRAFT_562423 [Pterulicium gracile]|uniref:Uncharacterized protein n=1 Tax=Pterulicium gracile TaxID=1884261 RepID=A0A5C3QSM7_9AGAR|nr:hypothetical protein BDV98DRAFT_562423 [Pterula gracilis]
MKSTDRKTSPASHGRMRSIFPVCLLLNRLRSSFMFARSRSGEACCVLQSGRKALRGTGDLDEPFSSSFWPWVVAVGLYTRCCRPGCLICALLWADLWRGRLFLGQRIWSEGLQVRKSTVFGRA